MTDPLPRLRSHPIAPPSHPHQFRAIGVVYGRYYPSEECWQRGVLATEGGGLIEAVLLGKLFSLFKHHVTLETPHFWVVYPRLRDKDDHLHIQLAGIWDPDHLGPGLTSGEPDPTLPPPTTNHPYFSVRGEVVFVSQAREVIVVKVRQAPKAPGKRPRFFKVKIRGVLKTALGEVCDRPLRHFWEIQATLHQNELVLESATDLGTLAQRPPRKPLRKGPPRRSAPPTGDLPSTPTPPSPALPKPLKRRLF